MKIPNMVLVPQGHTVAMTPEDCIIWMRNTRLCERFIYAQAASKDYAQMKDHVKAAKEGFRVCPLDGCWISIG